MSFGHETFPNELVYSNFLSSKEVPLIILQAERWIYKKKISDYNM